MSASKHSWFKSGLRFCASCSVTVAYWAVWIFLSTLGIALIYVALARELPVPEFILRQANANMARSGLALQFGRARFDPTGKILLENVLIRSLQYNEPLLTCRLLYVRLDFWSMLAGRNVPDEIQLEGAALLLPAMLSPSGTSEQLVSDLAVVLRHQDKHWLVEQFAGHLGRLTLTAQGEIDAVTRGPGATPFSLEALSARYIQIARKLAPLMYRLESFEDPTVMVQLSTSPSLGNTAALFLTVKTARMPWDLPLMLGTFSASTRLPLNTRTTHPLPVKVAIRRLGYDGKLVAESISALLNAEINLGSLTGRALDLAVRAGSLAWSGEEAHGPMTTTELSTWPVLRGSAAAQIDGEFLTVDIEMNIQAKQARLQAEGRVSSTLISRVLSEHTPRAASYFVFYDPVSFQAKAELGPGWHFETLTARVDAQHLDSHGVKIDSARGRIDIAGTSFLAHDARVAMGDSRARGSYWMDFASTDYRMLLDGRLLPVEINGWFNGDWWLNFWNRYFAFSSAPTAEVDLQGRWKDPTHSNNFVTAQVESATVWGGDFEQVDATLIVRPNFTHGLAVNGRRAGDTQNLTGAFKRIGVPETHETARFEFDFTSNADPAVLARLLEGRADDVLATLVFNQPPKFHAWGLIDHGSPAYRFVGEAGGGLSYYGFPLDSARVTGEVNGPKVRLDEIIFSAAGGHGTGRALLSGPPENRHLGFDIFVNKANLSRTIHAVEEYEAIRSGRKYVATPDGKFVRQAANSNLDVSISAQGKPEGIADFVGSGTASLTGAELGEIQLFGLLSQALKGLSLSFSTLKLDAAHSSFELRNGELYFPNLRVSGPTAVIDAKGKYRFDSNALDMTAKFIPYKIPSTLLAAAISIVVNPITSILELKLGGQLNDPKWSVVVGQSAATTVPAAKQPDQQPTSVPK